MGSSCQVPVRIIDIIEFQLLSLLPGNGYVSSLAQSRLNGKRDSKYFQLFLPALSYYFVFGETETHVHNSSFYSTDKTQIILDFLLPNRLL